MKLAEIHDILNPHLFTESKDLSIAWSEIEKAIELTDWPHGSGVFTIYPENGKLSGKGNGVKPIKIPCIKALRNFGWKIEFMPEIDDSQLLRTGDLDAVKETKAGYVAFEWETGNISSSHRALNKLLLAMRNNNILASFLVVPSNKLRQYLTDRIGNIGELKPYFPLWKDLPNINGALRIIAVEHDAESFDVPRIPKGTDGRARI